MHASHVLPSLCWTCLGWLRIRYLKFCLCQAPTLPLPTAATRTMQNRCFGGHSLCWPPLAFCLHAFAPAKVTSGFYILAANGQGARVRQERHNKSPLNTQRGHPERWEALATTFSSNASLFDVFCTPFNTFGLTAKDKEPGESAGTPLPLLPKGLFLGDASFDYLRRGTL